MGGTVRNFSSKVRKEMLITPMHLFTPRPDPNTCFKNIGSVYRLTKFDLESVRPENDLDPYVKHLQYLAHQYQIVQFTYIEQKKLFSTNLFAGFSLPKAVFW